MVAWTPSRGSASSQLEQLESAAAAYGLPRTLIRPLSAGFEHHALAAGEPVVWLLDEPVRRVGWSQRPTCLGRRTFVSLTLSGDRVAWLTAPVGFERRWGEVVLATLGAPCP